MLLATIVCIACLVVGATWSGYGRDKIPINASACKQFGISNYERPKLSWENILKWKLWPNLANNHEMAHGETVCFFEAAMERIWKHQHPVDCSKGKCVM